jgi:sugar O-acyltransferase (sialic acid O-acetyltransferase NeuD family)
MPATNIIIVGAGGFAREMECLLPSFLPDEHFQVRGFLGKDQGVESEIDLSGRLLGDPELYEPKADERFLLAIGEMEARRKTVEALRSKGAQFLTLVHPTAFVAPSAQLGHGVILFPFAAVSNNARLGDLVKLNYYASVGHDTRLGAYCLLAPYATVNGFGVLEEEVYMSTHATVAPLVRVGARSKVSANSCVMHDVPPASLVFGVPGRQAPRLDIDPRS